MPGDLWVYERKISLVSVGLFCWMESGKDGNAAVLIQWALGKGEKWKG